MTRPRSGLIRPTSDLRNTVLPVPEGPSMTLTSPGGRDSETSRHTTWCPKDFVSPSTTTSMPISPPWGNVGEHFRQLPSARNLAQRRWLGRWARPAAEHEAHRPLGEQVEVAATRDRRVENRI